MKESMRKIFSPILNYFESGSGEYNYKDSHRKILLVLGALFLFLSAVCVYISIQAAELGGIIPITVFFLTGAVSIIVGLFGNDQAVARIWKSK